MRNGGRTKGFTLIEVLIAMSIFTLFVSSIFFVYGNILEIMSRTRVRTLSSAVLNREIEMIRLLPYDQVGIVGGYPAGVIPQQRVEVYEGTQFLIKAYVRNIDDTFDGRLGQNPNDTAPADYRLVELEVTCALCYGIPPLIYTTWVAPENLETSTNNGSLFINVFDANGQPVKDADIVVTNASTSPAITIVDTSNASGQLQLVDIPTSTNRYAIVVSKPGYSTSVTYLPGASANPNPIQSHATIASQQITAMSFGIDKVSTLTVKTQDAQCVAVGSIGMNQVGTKLVGSGPDVVKYSGSFTTDSSGNKTVHPLEWDSYKFTNTSASYDIAGVTPFLPLDINPNVSSTLTFVLEPKTSTSLMVNVKNASGSALLGSGVNIVKSGVDITKVTGERLWTETNWNNGAYAASSGDLVDNNPAGEVRLAQVSGQYPTSSNSYLISNTYDFGTASVALHSLSFAPLTQPSGATLQFQLAANNDNATWSYIGPDGTASTYFSATSTLAAHWDNNRYLRYKAFLSTTNANNTPTLQDVSVSFDSGCTPAGNAFFPSLSTGTYTVTVSKSGYQTATSSVAVGSGWQETTLTLTP